MKAVDKYGVQMVFADYAQLIRGTDKKSGNREQEMAEVSRGLKQCAKENNIPVMAAAQMTRSKNEKEKPTLQSFRESGAYEQDGDVVIFPYRAEYYGILEDENGESTEGKAEMIIAKHRNGGLGNPVINFVARLTKFESGEMGEKSVPHPDSFIESKVRPNNKFLGEDVPF
jgi:replicative DNA helicase